MTSDEKEMCPLCMEPMEADDLAFYPCDCQYQVCRFCWTKIINEENGLCPACRKEYNSEEPAMYKPVSETEENKAKVNRRRKDNIRKQKLSPEMLKILPEFRVVQPNLVFVVGLPAWVCKDKEVLKGYEYFGRYGRVYKVEVNQNQMFNGPQGQPSFSAYITFYRAEDAMRSVRKMDHEMLHGRSLRISLGTTKYCSQFLRGAKCTKQDCMYLHELGDPAASFTKEEMQAGKHTEYMNKLLSEYFPDDYPALSAETSSANAVITSTTYSGSNLSSSPLTEMADSAILPAKCVHESSDQDGVINTHQYSSSTTNFTAKFPHNSRPRLLTDSTSQAYSDNRKQRHRRNEHMFSDGYSGHLISADNSFTKSNMWNHTGTVTSSEKHSVEKNMHHTVYHGITDDGSSPRSHSRSNEAIRRHGTNRPTNGRNPNATRKPHSADVFKKLTHLTHSAHVHNSNISAINRKHDNWRHSANSHPSAGFIDGQGEEPIDIDFDPFQESQQGLAELLAAEVNTMVVTDKLIHPSVPFEMPVTGHNYFKPITTNPTTNSVDPESTDAWLSDYGNTNQISNETLPYAFDSRMNPPPGFEENLSHTSPDPLSISNNAYEQCGHSPLRSNHNDSYPLVSTSHNSNHHPFNMSHVIDKLSSNHDPTIHPRSAPDQPPTFSSSAAAQTYPPAQSGFPNTNSWPDSQNAVANLFAAVFHTTTALLNGQHSGGCTPYVDGNKSDNPKPQSIDLNALFNQLCGQTPFSTPPSNAWHNGGGGSGESNSSDVMFNPNTAAAAISAAASILFPTVQFQSNHRDVPTNCDDSQGMYMPMNIPPGLAKQSSSYSDPTSKSTRFPDPTLSKEKSHELWQSGPPLDRSFEQLPTTQQHVSPQNTSLICETTKSTNFCSQMPDTAALQTSSQSTDR